MQDKQSNCNNLNQILWNRSVTSTERSYMRYLSHGYVKILPLSWNHLYKQNLNFKTTQSCSTKLLVCFINFFTV